MPWLMKRDLSRVSTIGHGTWRRVTGAAAAAVPKNDIGVKEGRNWTVDTEEKVRDYGSFAYLPNANNKKATREKKGLEGSGNARKIIGKFG